MYKDHFCTYYSYYEVAKIIILSNLGPGNTFESTPTVAIKAPHGHYKPQEVIYLQSDQSLCEN